MPSSPPKPCRHAGCPALDVEGSGFCAEHQQDRYVGRFGDRARGSRHKRGYGREWDRMRKETLAEDQGLCRLCRAKGRFVRATEVDHITPKAEGGTDDPGNRQSLCESCHRQKTQEEARRGRCHG